MRVITGSARGKRLQTLEGEAVRPTPEKVKEAIFSSIQFDLEGRRFLDLFAGCGQMGIEALSRGAASCCFCDASAASVEVIRRNLEQCGLSANARVVKTDYVAFLASQREVFDIAFLDPPYKAGLLLPALEKTAQAMSPYGLILCEHPAEVTLPDAVAGFSRAKQYKYGKIYISLYKKGDRP